ncbi:PadR family transcriptional regulator [Candidatus Micrarchaeota archaeon]|nr:PadR family transcriptional regulator [Candidatus Micrarchaeota archaeon]
MRNLNIVPSHILKKMYLFILWLISKRELHGYGMIKLLNKEGMKHATASRLYPLLNIMYKENLIFQKEKKQGKRVRKIYALTAKGKKKLSDGKKMFPPLMREFLKEMIG